MTDETIFINGRDVREFGLHVVEGGQHDVLPETRDRTLAIPGRHGLLDYGADLGVREFDIPCVIKDATDSGDLQHKLRKLANELTDAYGRPKSVRLTFSEEPDKYYNVRYTGRIGVDRITRHGFFSLAFTAFDPMAKSVFTSDQITLGSDVPIMSDILLGTGESSRKVFREGSFLVTNSGSSAVRLSCVISGSGNSVALEANGRRFTLGSFTNKTIAIDGENYLVKVDGVADLTNTGGHFIDLLPGENEIYVSGSSLNLTISDSLRYDYV